MTSASSSWALESEGFASGKSSLTWASGQCCGVRLTGSDVLLQVHYIGEAGQFRRNLVRKQVNTTCQHLIQETKKISPIHSIHTAFFSGWSKTHKYCLFSFSDIQDVPVIFQVTFTAFHSSRWDIIYKRPLSWIQLKRRKRLNFCTVPAGQCRICLIAFDGVKIFQIWLLAFHNVGQFDLIPQNVPAAKNPANNL